MDNTNKYIKANLIHLLYWDGTAYKALAYAQSHEMNFSVDTNDISSKDHGAYPDREVTGSSWSMSGEYYFTKENADIIMAMAKSTKNYTFAFCQVKDVTTGDSLAATGLKNVTGAGDTVAWTATDAVWKQYGNALITNCSISAGVGEVATISLELTGSGALVDDDSTLTKTGYTAS